MSMAYRTWLQKESYHPGNRDITDTNGDPLEQRMPEQRAQPLSLMHVWLNLAVVYPTSGLIGSPEVSQRGQSRLRLAVFSWMENE